MTIPTSILWSFSQNNRPSYGDLDAIGELLVESLSKNLGVKIEIAEQHLVQYESLVFTIRCQQQLFSPFRFYWEGKLLYTVTRDLPSIDVELFLFLDNQRICSTTGRTLFKLRGLQSQGGDVEWKCLGWVNDEFDEWSYIKEPQWMNVTEVRRTLD